MTAAGAPGTARDGFRGAATPFDEERVVEEVARAIYEAEIAWEANPDDGRYRTLAAAAVAAYQAQADR